MRSSNFGKDRINEIWQKKLRAKRKIIKRAKDALKNLQNIVSKTKADCSNVNIESILQKCIEDKIPDRQQQVIR